MDPAFVKQIVDLGSFAVLGVLVLLTFFYAVPKVMKAMNDMRCGFSEDLNRQRTEFMHELAQQRELFHRMAERHGEALNGIKDMILMSINKKKD